MSPFGDAQRIDEKGVAAVRGSALQELEEEWKAPLESRHTTAGEGNGKPLRSGESHVEGCAGQEGMGFYKVGRLAYKVFTESVFVADAIKGPKSTGFKGLAHPMCFGERRVTSSLLDCFS